MRKNSRTLSPTDWFEAACAVLKAQGHHRVNLRDLSAELGVSTGSFYHHFKNRDDFVERLFEYWAEKSGNEVREVIEEGLDSLNEINRQVNHIIDHRLEAAMRAWGLFDGRVAKKIQSVDDARRKFFREYYGDRLEPAIARDLIDLHLCSLAGAQFIFLDKPRRLSRFGAFVNEVAEGRMRLNESL